MGVRAINSAYSTTELELSTCAVPWISVSSALGNAELNWRAIESERSPPRRPSRCTACIYKQGLSSFQTNASLLTVIL